MLHCLSYETSHVVVLCYFWVQPSRHIRTILRIKTVSVGMVSTSGGSRSYPGTNISVWHKFIRNIQRIDFNPTTSGTVKQALFFS